MRTTSPKPKQPKEELLFGATFTDHLLECDWDVEKGWHTPRIIPYGDFAIDPAASVLHYGIEVRCARALSAPLWGPRPAPLRTHCLHPWRALQLFAPALAGADTDAAAHRSPSPLSLAQCFEGMKAYLDADNQIRLFRPDCNMERMNDSMARLHMPTFDSDAYIACIKELLRVDKSWIPEGEGYSLYIRPTAISTYAYVGVGPTNSAKLYTILSPVGPYYPSGFAPIKLLADDKYVRAWPGGTGNTKVGGNYGPTIKPQMEAAEKGYTQVLWLFGEEHFITEVGTMNLFFVWEKPEGGLELVTPPLDRGDILPGVTRRSVLDLVREWGGMEVNERNCTMAEVVSAVEEGRMVESFGTGTAAVLCPVAEINYNGAILPLPLKSGGVSGELCQRLWDAMADIHYGRQEHEWSVLVEE